MCVIPILYAHLLIRSVEIIRYTRGGARINPSFIFTRIRSLEEGIFVKFITCSVQFIYFFVDFRNIKMVGITRITSALSAANVNIVR